MQYKTIILELIRQNPTLHQRLATSRTLLPTVERYAQLLKQSHEIWIEQLQPECRQMEEGPLSSAALELALEQIAAPLLAGLEPDETESLSLDEAMQFLRTRHSQN